MSDRGNVSLTDMLQRAAAGDRPSFDVVFEKLYEELRRQAELALRRENPGHTLRATALVHEAYLRLVDGARCSWEDRSHFLAIAARSMRQVLVDHARGKNAQKRGGDAERVTLTLVHSNDESHDVDLQLLDLDDALTELASLSPRQAEVAELRLFGGLQIKEAATVLSIAPSTVQDHWTFAKAWLKNRIGA